MCSEVVVQSDEVSLEIHTKFFKLGTVTENPLINIVFEHVLIVCFVKRQKMQ